MRDCRLSVVCRCSRSPWWWGWLVGSGDWERAESGVRGVDRLGPGPGRVDVQDVSACGAHEPSGGGENAQPQPLGFVAGGGGGQREPGAPGQQVLSERADRDPDAVLVGVVEGQVTQPGVLRRADAVLDAGVAAVA